MEAIHGDLGMMVPGDVCLMISHSGNTDELLATVPWIKHIGLPIITMTANPESRLARYADIILNTHVNEEACPYNLAPTSSTAAALAFGDAIAKTLLKMKGFKEDALATEALKKMQNNKITSLIVTKEIDEIVGLIHIHHLLEQGFYYNYYILTRTIRSQK
jgi:D-arabinose 5-phosphate isomerase GutQ